MILDKDTAALVLEYFARNLHSSASTELHDLLRNGDAERFWEEWTNEIERRCSFLGLSAIEHAYLWGGTVSRPNLSFPYVLKEDIVLAFLSLSIQMTRMIRTISPIYWFEQIADTVELLSNASELAHPRENPLVHQLLLGEHRLYLGLLYPDLIPFRSFAQSGKRQLIKGMEQIVNEQGEPDLHDLEILRPLLACWTRSLILATNAGQVLFPATIMRRFEWVVLQTIRWTRFDGQMIYSPASDQNPYEDDFIASLLELLDAALQFDEDPGDKKAAAVALAPLARRFLGFDHASFDLRNPKKDLPEKKNPSEIFVKKVPLFLRGKKGSETDPTSLPDPSGFGDHPLWAVFRPDWKPASPALYLAANSPVLYQRSLIMNNKKEFSYPIGFGPDQNELFDTRVKMEFNHCCSAFLSGMWNVNIALDHKKIAPAGPWSLICSDYEQNYSYIEWEIPLENGYRIERHCLFAFEEKVLFLADALLPCGEEEKNRKIDYEMILPIAKNIIVEADAESAEIALSAILPEDHPKRKKGKESQRIRILPIGLNEWKQEEDVSKFDLAEKGLILKTVKSGRTLFAPLFIDLNEKRIDRPCTWRHLTVGENREETSPEDACGYRVQIGKDQYLIYCSLGPEKSRSVLGHNLKSDFLFAVFSKTEGVLPVVEVERKE
ncbi:MAG: hypothetical protein Q4G69_03085 [Planctomycetia bacterium]|nr:hypothetical protein [Planctomycetia bacterium]